MRIFLLVLHIIIALFLIGIVLLQPGEDAGGTSKTMTGQANLLTKLTGFLGAFFFISSLSMAILIRKETKFLTSPVQKIASGLTDQDKKIETKISETQSSVSSSKERAGETKVEKHIEKKTEKVEQKTISVPQAEKSAVTAAHKEEDHHASSIKHKEEVTVTTKKTITDTKTPSKMKKKIK